MLDGLAAYERRHGWRVPHNVLHIGTTIAGYSHPDWQKAISPGMYLHALVISVSSSSALVKLGPYNATITARDVLWIRRSLPQLLSVGDIVYVQVLSLGPNFQVGISLEEDSGVQGALVAIDNKTGGIKAMVGGRDFNV